MPRSILFRAAVLTSLAVVIAVPTFAAPTNDEVDIERISFHRRSDGQGYVVRLHTDAPVSAFSVDETDGGVALVVFRAHVARRLVRGQATGPVRSYRVEAADDRVTFHFATRGEVEAVAYPDRDSDDLLLSLTTAPARTVPTRQETRTESRPAPPVMGTSTPAPSGGGATHWHLDTIVLDAGHGGHDAGGVGIGITDRDVALAVVRRLGPMIERELGVNVVYTRDDNTFVELRERGRIANRSGGKLFISVHGNSGPSSASGTETFFLAPRGQGNARSVMERENAVIDLESDPSLYADFHDEGNILASLAMSAYQEESQLLARLIESRFVADGRRSRGVKQDNFIVLWAASMPAVLVEVGFVTNPGEARYLGSEDGQARTARAIFEAVREYKEQYERGLRLAATG